MESSSLQRVRGDLATMQQAAGFGLTFSKYDVWGLLAMGACGLAGSIATVLLPAEDYRYAGLMVVPLVFIALWVAKSNHAQRARQPQLWREAKLGLWIASIVGPAAILYIHWERSVGMPREMTGAAAVFFCGLATLLLGLFDRNRRPLVAAGISLMGYGLAIPYCTARQVVMFGGLCVCVACVGQAWMMSRILKAADHVSAAD